MDWSEILTVVLVHGELAIVDPDDLSDEGDGAADEVWHVDGTDEGVRLAMDILHFLCHSALLLISWGASFSCWLLDTH